MHVCAFARLHYSYHNDFLSYNNVYTFQKNSNLYKNPPVPFPISYFVFPHKNQFKTHRYRGVHEGECEQNALTSQNVFLKKNGREQHPQKKGHRSPYSTLRQHKVPRQRTGRALLYVEYYTLLKKIRTAC